MFVTENRGQVGGKRTNCGAFLQTATATHGGGSVMVWECFTSTRKFATIDSQIDPPTSRAQSTKNVLKSGRLSVRC